MTDNTAATEAAATTTPKRAPIEYTLVTMDDGRKVEFAGKRKMLKDTMIGEDGSVTCRFDFVNGESRTFKIPDSLLLRFAGHGCEQKFGDETAGLADIDDIVLAIDELSTRMATGLWGQPRAAGNSLAGTSVLARALCEQSGKDIEVIKTFLAGKTQAEKVALRSNPKIAPIVARLEADKVKKVAKQFDTEAMLSEIA